MGGLFAPFWNGSYAPHGYCLLWQPELVWTHVIADGLTAAAYFSIPLAIIALVRQRRDLVFGWAFWCFAIFILACGVTHLMSIWTLWQPVYGLQALVKVITAGASVATAALLWPLLPRAVALPSPDRLQAANAELATMIRERDTALEELRAQIAQRERVEAALLQSQKLEAVGQLTGGIAHDFNNLLQAVAGNLELIARKPDDSDRVVRWAGAALDAVERGRALSGQLLAFSRKQRLELAPVPVQELIGGMRELVARAVAPLSQVEIAPIDPLLRVEADPLQLELAILNLAFNARDAMGDGGTLRISATSERGVAPAGLPLGDWAAITVSDSGHGMTPDVLARATEPFFTTKEVGRGTGMGLAMVFGVVTQSGGTVHIESAPGEGTAVTLYLRQSTKARGRTRTPKDAEAVPVSLTGATIALVDDDAQVRATLADMLETAGATVEQAGDGASALEMVAARRPDVLIVDFAMPGMSGAEVVRRIREQDRTLPIVLVTGFAETAAIDSLDNGQLTILRKPFETRDLLRRVQSLLGHD